MRMVGREEERGKKRFEGKREKERREEKRCKRKNGLCIVSLDAIYRKRSQRRGGGGAYETSTRDSRNNV